MNLQRILKELQSIRKEECRLEGNKLSIDIKLSNLSNERRKLFRLMDSPSIV